ncbi:MAG: porin [Candidatus Aminicenantes bacterium]|nr:porin [Candidatus Aminicenantes bacterium]
MRTKVILVLVIFFSFLPLGLAQVQIRGYLSLEYMSGQEESDVHLGSFKNSQLGLFFSGEIAPKFDYAAELRSEGTAVKVEQAWVRYKASESFALSAGFFLVPFGRYNQSNRPYQTDLINPPLQVEEMYPWSWRELGILLEGRISSLFYSAYVGNGLAEKLNLKESQQFEDNNKNKALGARAGLFLSQNLAVAFSYYRGKYDEDNSRYLSFQGADLIWEFEGLHFLAEYSRASLENPEPYSSGEIKGYFVQVSFNIDSLRPVVSYQYLEYDDPYHGLGFILPSYPGGGIFEEKSRWSFGLVYFFAPTLVFKLEYDYNREKILELKNNTISAQVALSF